jgi:hypothetical protein
MGATDARGGAQGPTRSTPWCVCASRRSSRWPGRVIPKKPEAIPVFQATCQAHRQRVIPPANTRPVRGFSHDDSRFGLLTMRRRRRTARGVPPVGPVQQVFEWWSVDGAVEPTTGDRCCLERPSLNADLCQLCIEAFAHACPDRLNLLRLDNSGAHTASRLTLPENIRRLFLPPAGPALNPLARVWREPKDDLAWRQCTGLEAQQDDLGDLLRADEASTRQTRTGYPDLVEAIDARCV